MADSFRNSVNGSLYEWACESLVHTIRSKRGFIQKLNTTGLLGDAQQFCCGFKGNIFYAKLSKNIILCLKYNTISTSYLLNCWKSHLSLWYLGQNQHSCDIALPPRVLLYNMRQKHAFMELLPCIIFVNSQLYEMEDDVQVWGWGQCVNCVKIF